MSNNETYERVTGVLLGLIEKGDLLPWQKPWLGKDMWARSMSTNHEYNGVNRWVLTLTSMQNGWSHWWGTYKQIAALGGQVRKGEKSTLAIYWNIKEVTDKVTGDVKKIAFLRTFSLFSASQADGLPEKFYAKPESTGTVSDVTAEQVFNSYVTTYGIPVKVGGTKAFYSPAMDFIQVPPTEAFLSAEHEAATKLHEAAHSTGHASRLNRAEIQDFQHFGDHLYSREELVAELASALVLGVLGLDKPNVVENQAAYLKHWRSKLTDDPQAFVWAAGRAEKAANMILGETETDPATAEKEGE